MRAPTNKAATAALLVFSILGCTTTSKATISSEPPERSQPDAGTPMTSSVATGVGVHQKAEFMNCEVTVTPELNKRSCQYLGSAHIKGVGAGTFRGRLKCGEHLEFCQGVDVTCWCND